mmetsp:Transcript_72270/g.211790  ORF Transcript_72270/g.211790 Transcript_72270/m.211790 type:complete len:169 (+) Transcript_72270:190-696(+)
MHISLRGPGRRRTQTETSEPLALADGEAASCIAGVGVKAVVSECRWCASDFVGELLRWVAAGASRGTAGMEARFITGLVVSAPTLEALLISRIRGRSCDDVDLGVIQSLPPSSSSSEKYVPFKGEKWRLLLTALRLPAGTDPASSTVVEFNSPPGLEDGDAMQPPTTL